jgi:hypothetical protein
MEGRGFHGWCRSLRAWFYRRVPAGGSVWHLKRRAGYERRWGLETAGFTKEGFLGIFQKKFLRGLKPGRMVELVAGDGLVGSLGLWLERIAGWQVEAWEHRKWPTLSFPKNRPSTRLHHDRLTEWTQPTAPKDPVGITTRGVREAAGVCRAIRKKWIRPAFLGIWNPSRVGVWEKRLHGCGYRLELIYERMEFYRLRNP